MSWPQTLAEPLARALGWTLVDSLWQGALLALLLAVLWQPARRWSASARYGICALALVLLAVTPAITLTMLLSADGSPFPAVQSWSTPHVAATILHTPAATRASLVTWRSRCEAALPWVTGIWAIGVLFLSIRRAGGWLWLMRVRNRWEEGPEHLFEILDGVAARLGIHRLPHLKIAPGAGSPSVIGWLRPLIVMPAATLAGIGTADLEALLAHELAHIRRHDYLANLLQTAVETLLFYHPLVWWLGRQMRIEREHCCDDLAVGVCGDRVRYARTLVDLAGRSAPSSFAMAAAGGSLSARVKRLLAGDPPSALPPIWPALIVGAGVCAILIGGNTGVHAAGQTPAQPAPQKVEQPMPTDDKPSPFPRVAAKDLKDQVEAVVERVAEMDAPDPPDPPDPPDADDDDSDEAKGEWLNAMIHSGLHNLSVDDLIQLREHGVSTELVKETVRSMPNASVKEVVELADRGVDPEFIHSMRSALGSTLSLKDLARLRDHGVDPDFVSSMHSLLGSSSNAEELIKLRDHGVDGAFIRRLNRSGFDKLSADQLIRMRDAGL